MYTREAVSTRMLEPELDAMRACESDEQRQQLEQDTATIMKHLQRDRERLLMT